MGHLNFNFAELAPMQRYKLLCGLVVPRPIALVTSISPAGVVNAAPFSFFKVFSEHPALIVLGLQHNPDGSPKDTTRNVHASGEFVVNLVDEGIAEAMTLTATDFPPGEGEPRALGMATLPSTLVQPPRLAATPAAFECRRTVSLAFGPQRELLVGEVLGAQVREGIVDPLSLNVDFAALAPVGRLCGAAYARQRDRFELKQSATPSGKPGARTFQARRGAHANCTAPIAITTAACVGSSTVMPSAASSGARCLAMPAQPMMTTSAPS